MRFIQEDIIGNRDDVTRSSGLTDLEVPRFEELPQIKESIAPWEESEEKRGPVLRCGGGTQAEITGSNSIF